MMNQMASMVGPMTAATGLRPGAMTSGMGIVTGGATAESAGPAFGRTIGVGAEAAHEMIADSATWEDRREPMLDNDRILDDFRDGD